LPAILDCIYVFWNPPWLLCTSEGSLAGHPGCFLGVIILPIASQLLLYESFDENHLISGGPGSQDLALIVLVIICHCCACEREAGMEYQENEDMG
jgi:hypothetical protein